MDLDRFNRLLMESVGVGLALIDPDTLAIAFANARGSRNGSPTVPAMTAGSDAAAGRP